MMVTGAGAGIGAAIATAAASAGYRAVVCDIDDARASAVSAGIPGALCFQLDGSVEA